MTQLRTFALALVASIFAGSAIFAAGKAHSSASKYTVAAREADRAAERIQGELELRTAFESVAEAVRPSVVSIAMRRPAERQMNRRLRGGLMQGPDERGVGSGVIVSADGFVLTNNHVIADASEVVVHLCDGRELAATVVGTDPRTDLAVLKIDAGDVRPLQFADSGKLKVGQWVAAFGTPFGLDQTMSSGIVSALGRTNMHITDYEDFIQTDAAINPGNSGGPLVDLHGRLVGINSAIVSSNGGSNGIGFAIPCNLVRSIYERLIRDGQVVRGWVGIAIQDVTPALAAEFAFEDQYENGERGVLVGDVSEASPASRAGMRSGDIVTRLDGVTVDSVQQFRNRIADFAPGTRIELAVWRDGKSLELDAEIGVLPGTP